MSHRSIAFLLLSQLLFLDVAEAVTIRVPSDQPTILSGLDAAVAGDTVLVAPGAYGGLETRSHKVDWGPPIMVTACGFLKDNVVLKSELGAASTILDVNGQGGGPGTSYLIGDQFTTLGTVIEGFTFRGAETGVQGIWIAGSELTTIRGCRFEDFRFAQDLSGAIKIDHMDAEIHDCVFLRCTSTETGSAISNLSSNLVLDGCHVEECSARSGPIRLSSGPHEPPHSLYIRNCMFIRNSSTQNGGVLQTFSTWSTQMIESSLFVENMSGSGGALKIFSGQAAVIRNCVFARNAATAPNGFGGAIYAAGWVEIEGCTFWANSQSNAIQGGAAVYAFPDPLLERNIFAASIGSEAVFTLSLDPDGGCNDYWGNTQGDLDEGLEPYTTDLFIDPQFCDPKMDDWTMAKGSPCLPEASGVCGQIGALGQGCETESVESLSWGRIKELYR